MKKDTIIFSTSGVYLTSWNFSLNIANILFWHLLNTFSMAFKIDSEIKIIERKILGYFQPSNLDSVVFQIYKSPRYCTISMLSQ